MVVSELMTKSPRTAKVADTLSTALGILYEEDVRHLPVLEGSALIGMMSARDVQGALAPSMLSGAPRPVEEMLEQTLGEVMSRDVITVGPEDAIAEAVELMLSHRVGALPVVDPSSAELVGILSYVDVLRAAAEAL